MLDEHYAEQHRVRPIRPGRYVMLAVSDTGHGMDAADASRASSNRSSRPRSSGKGTGLGLATVYGIVKQAGGHIWVYSEPGQGTTFKVYLPAASRPPVALDPDRIGRRPREGRRLILLVEDAESGAGRRPARSLERKGYTVLVVPPSREAAIELARADAGPIDLVADGRRHAGHRAAATLADRLGRAAPGLPRRSSSPATPRRTFSGAGLVEEGRPFLAKPFTPDEIAAKVGMVLSAPARAHDHSPYRPVTEVPATIWSLRSITIWTWPR